MMLAMTVTRREKKEAWLFKACIIGLTAVAVTLELRF